MPPAGGFGSVRLSVGLAAVAVLVACAVAEAHRVDLSLRVVGSNVEGTVTYHGGRPVAGGTVELRLGSGEVLATAVTDGQGRFSVPVSRRGALEVVVHTADGHAVRSRLAAEALPPDLGGQATAATREAQEELARRVAHLVGGEVSRQLVPISDGLADLERRVAVRDVLGGLGYLLGLAGLAAYLLARRRGGGEDAAR